MHEVASLLKYTMIAAILAMLLVFAVVVTRELAAVYGVIFQ